jgi:hypothetical protein
MITVGGITLGGGDFLFTTIENEFLERESRVGL